MALPIILTVTALGALGALAWLALHAPQDALHDPYADDEGLGQ